MAMDPSLVPPQDIALADTLKAAQTGCAVDAPWMIPPLMPVVTTTDRAHRAALRADGKPLGSPGLLMYARRVRAWRRVRCLHCLVRSRGVAEGFLCGRSSVGRQQDAGRSSNWAQADRIRERHYRNRSKIKSPAPRKRICASCAVRLTMCRNYPARCGIEVLIQRKSSPSTSIAMGS
jgi:hypothetical protein